ncbi:hypothetical protein RQP46_009510 [Phenoliferia psychrophenolica]
MGTIQKMQLRVAQLQAALQSGTLPPGPNYAGGQPMNPDQKEHAQKELHDLKTRQLALVSKCQSFVEMNGGQQRLKPEAFAASLKTVMAKRGIVIEESYHIEGVKVPLYDLYQAVMVTGGGGEKVDADRSWVLIAQEIKMPDSASFADALAELFNRILRPYEDVWSTALLKQRDKMALANAQRSRESSSSDGGSGSGSGSAPPPRSLPPTNLRFSEPASSRPMRGPPPPPIPPSAPPSSYLPTPNSVDQSFDQTLHPSPSFNGSASWSTSATTGRAPPEESVEDLVAQAGAFRKRVELRRQQDQGGPFSQPQPGAPTTTNGLSMIFGGLAPPPPSTESSRFEELSPSSIDTPPAKKGRTSKAGSSVGHSPADSTSTNTSSSNNADSPAAGAAAKAKGRPKTGAAAGRKRARPANEPNPDPNPLEVDDVLGSLLLNSSPGQNPNGEPSLPPFPIPTSSSSQPPYGFPVIGGWNGETPPSIWPPAGASSSAFPYTNGFDPVAGPYDFDSSAALSQFLAPAPVVSPALTADTPDLVAAHGNDASPPSDDQEPFHPSSSSASLTMNHSSQQNQKGTTGPTLGIDTMAWDGGDTMSPFVGSVGFGPPSGVSDGWDPSDPNKWQEMSQPFDFDAAFNWPS